MNKKIQDLINFMKRIPAVGGLDIGGDKTYWWVKFKIDIDHDLAWNVVQELGHVLNSIEGDDRLPTSFYPVSPLPLTNGGPEHVLSWVIDNEEEDFSFADLHEWLEARLPDPVDNEDAWFEEDEEEEEEVVVAKKEVTTKKKKK